MLWHQGFLCCFPYCRKGCEAIQYRLVWKQIADRVIDGRRFGLLLRGKLWNDLMLRCSNRMGFM